MKHLFDVIYYQAYLFYSKVLKEDDPHFTTTWAVGIVFAFFITFNLRIIKDMYTCYDYSTVIYFIFSMGIVFFVYLYYSHNNRREHIIKTKPLFKNSILLSRCITIIYFTVCASMLFIGPILGKHYNDLLNCK